MLQVAFVDGSALLLRDEGRLATMLDHAGGRVTLRVPEALSYFSAAASAPVGSVVPDRLVFDVCRRLRYARDVLQQLTTAATAGTGGGEALKQ